MFERRKNRSDKYQNLFAERSFPVEVLEQFSNDDNVFKRLNPFDYNEEVLNLQDQLKEEFWRVVNTMLTQRQREVLRLSADGLTQMEIAKILDVNQSSVTKSLHGNVDYKKNSQSYGGSIKKLKKLMETDPKVQEILKKISELRGEI